MYYITIKVFCQVFVKVQIHIRHFDAKLSCLAKGRLTCLWQSSKNIRGHNMQYHNLYYRLPKSIVAKSLEKAVYDADFDKTAKERQHILLFYDKHGFKTTQEAYPKIKRSTLLNWQKKYAEFGIEGLICGKR
jgi:hypothetical protein